MSYYSSKLHHVNTLGIAEGKICRNVRTAVTATAAIGEDTQRLAVVRGMYVQCKESYGTGESNAIPLRPCAARRLLIALKFIIAALVAIPYYVPYIP